MHKFNWDFTAQIAGFYFTPEHEYTFEGIEMPANSESVYLFYTGIDKGPLCVEASLKTGEIAMYLSAG